jgi:hypothetical protein
MMSMFNVDRKGLMKQMADRGTGWMIRELMQNAWDADGVSRVDLTLEPIPGQPLTRLTVEDDSPAGFCDLSHAYTLFAESPKKGDPTKRGYFNIGEKLVVAVAKRASIISTTGAVYFEGEERRISRERRKRGTLFEAVVPMTRDEMVEALDYSARCIPPKDVVTTINGQPLASPALVRAFVCTLQTLDQNPEGYRIKRMRQTEVRLHEKAGKMAWLYEMGIPVLELDDDPYDVDVGQRIPVQWERDNVPPSWLKKLRTEILNAAHDTFDEEAAASQAITEAIAGAEREAIRSVIKKRFPRGATFSPSDLEANNTWVALGNDIVHGGTFDGETWKAINAAEALRPTIQYCPTPKPFAEVGEPPSFVAPTPAMARFEKFVRWFAQALLGHDIAVCFYQRMNDDRVAACYGRGSRELGFNMRRVGRRWFEGPLEERHVDLLIHEFGHDYESNHLDDRYHSALTRLGAQAAFLALTRPEAFKLDFYEECAA